MDFPWQPILPIDSRVKWAAENFSNGFEDVVWTDESMIQLENHRTFSYRKVGKVPKPKARPKNPYKVMVWAGISKKGATNICLINGSVDSLVYQDILCTHLLPFLQEKLLTENSNKTMLPVTLRYLLAIFQRTMELPY